jgi:uridylate kinase
MNNSENQQIKYHRILLKLSGEALSDANNSISSDVLNYITDEIIELVNLKVQVGVVIGGGNIFRGLTAVSSNGMDRNAADHMGMLATMINSVALCESLNRKNCETVIFSSMNMGEISERFSAYKAIKNLEKGKVVILGGGTGHPYFTTDTTAALRALEIKAQIMVKATKVNGIYDSDPVKNHNAKKFNAISYTDMLNQKLKVMDLTAVSLCMDNQLPIMVLDMNQKGNIKKAVLGEDIGSTVIP